MVITVGRRVKNKARGAQQPSHGIVPGEGGERRATQLFNRAPVYYS
jgi:hypothetical protein